MLKRPARGTWLAVAGVVLLQLLLFRAFVLREASPFYPRGFDQSRYLSHTYAMFEAALDKGPAAQVASMLWGAAAFRPVNGVLVPIEALVLFELFGASRLVALTPGLLHFVAWQVSMLLVLRRLSGSLACGVAGAGLILALGTPFTAVAGIADYRFDFPAVGMFGVSIALVLRSSVYRDRAWSIGSGVAYGLLVLVRYLTAAYLAGISAVMLAALVWRAFRQDPVDAGETWQRVRNLVLAGVATLVVAAPTLWMGRRSIYDYYLSPRIDHSHGVWRLSDTGLAAVRTYGIFAGEHLTTAFVASAVIAIAACLLVRSLSGSALPRPAAGSGTAGSVPYLLVAGAVPLAFLASYPAQSSGAIGIVMPPLVALCGMALARAWPQPSGADRSGADPAFGRWVGVGVAATVMAVGLARQVGAYGSHVLRGPERQAAAESTRMLEEVGRLCEEMGWMRPRISVTAVRDDLAGAGLTLMAQHYERHGALLDIQGRLAESVLGVDEAALRTALADSDLVFDVSPSSGVDVPFRRAIEPLLPIVADALERDFVPVETFSVGGQPVRVHASTRVVVRGVSGDWLTKDGTRVAVPRRLLQPGARVVLRGPCAPTLPCGVPATARSTSARPEQVPLPTETRSDGRSYELRIGLPDAAGDEDPLVLQVTFARAFVPAADGSSTDTRQLAVLAPRDARVELDR